jgi:DNA-binding PadR family transcriptional regulator
MSEPALLSLLMRYPHPVAIARRVNSSALYTGLERLERRGFVVRRRGLYRVTTRGRRALEFDEMLGTIVRRGLRSV